MPFAGERCRLISQPVVNTIASREIDLPLNGAGPPTNRDLSINTSGMKDDVGMYLCRILPLHTGPRGFRRNLVCFAKSGQVDRLPLPRLIPAVIFGRCHCSRSPGSVPGFRCERQAGCQVLLASFTHSWRRLRSPGPGRRAAHPSDITQRQEQQAVVSGV